MSRKISRVRLPDGRRAIEDAITISNEKLSVTIYEYRTRFWGCVIDKCSFEVNDEGRIEHLEFLD